MEKLLEVTDLRVAFPTSVFASRAAPLTRPAANEAWHEVVCGVSFSLAAGQALAIVGQSGAGKSQALLALFGLSPDNARIAGQVLFDRQAVLALDAKRLNHLRGSNIGFVFQDPKNALNPYLSLGTQICEVLTLRRGVKGRAARERAIQLLAQVGLPDPVATLGSYPHTLSGGMAQRAMLAMALANEPRLLIADEPTTALDVTVQAGILVLLRTLCAEQNIALLLVTHDLAVAQVVCDSVLVMQAGRVVESGLLSRILAHPEQPASRTMIAAARREVLRV